MKRSFVIILAFVVAAFVFAGCRRKTVPPTTAPTVMPTTAPTTAPTTRPTTAPTTAPTTMPPAPTEEETIEGGLGDTQETTDDAARRTPHNMPRGF